MRQHLMIQPPPPSTTNPAIPPDLDKVILIALAKQPEARFGSVMAFTRAFQQAIQPASESSSPPGFIMPTVEAVPQRASEPLSDPVRLVPTAPPPPIEAQTPSPLAPTQYANGPAPMPAHTKKSRIMGLALIALVLVLISSLLFGVSAYQQYAHNLANATATAQANTAATQATVDAIAQAGTPYGGTLIISDPMDGSSSAFQWDNRNDSNGDQCQFNGGAYHVSGECSSSYFPPAKFAFEIQLVAFHSCGEINYLSKGFLDDAGNFGISICQDGSYQLSGNGNIQQGSASSMDTGPDQSNIVDVVIDGSNITLYINQTNVASIPDNAAYLGSLSLWGVDSNYVVGLGTGTSNDFQEVVYTNARLWSL